MFSPDGTLLASVSDTGLRLWDVTSPGEVEVLIEDTDYDTLPQYCDFDSIAFSPDGTMLATSDWQICLHLWDVASRKVRFTHYAWERTGISRERKIAFSPDGNFIAYLHGDKIIRLWDVPF